MILVDTSFFFPLFNQSDPDHGKVRAALQDFRGQRPRDVLLTTNHIVFETVTLARSRVIMPSPSASARRCSERRSPGSIGPPRMNKEPPLNISRATRTRSTVPSIASVSS